MDGNQIEPVAGEQREALSDGGGAPRPAHIQR